MDFTKKAKEVMEKVYEMIEEADPAVIAIHGDNFHELVDAYVKEEILPFIKGIPEEKTIEFLLAIASYPKRYGKRYNESFVGYILLEMDSWDGYEELYAHPILGKFY